jgi:hypothetical protein
MKTNTALLFLTFASMIFCCVGAAGQTVNGKVVSKSGEPVPGVAVYGSKETCCPATVKSTITSVDGAFSLTKPGLVLHFRRTGFQPSTLRLYKNTPLTMVMRADEASTWAIPVCSATEPLRFGQTFLFLRSTGESLAKGGDIDYSRFGVKGQDGALLDSWFGPTAASMDASEDLYVKSESFSERFVEVSGFGIVGIDAQGTLKNGRRWRWLGLNFSPGEGRKSLLGTAWRWPRTIATDMIRYQDATNSEASEFNKILGSVCLKPNEFINNGASPR